MNLKNFVATFIAITTMSMAHASTIVSDSLYVSIDSVYVSGTRAPMTIADNTRLVTVLDSVSISSLPAVSVNDLLKYSAGVDVRQRGDMGAQTDISLRGGTSDQVAIYLNGINICDPQTGHNAMDLPVDVREIERIEILSGPAGVAYGSSSLLGAINIVTRKPVAHSIRAHIEGGSFGYYNTGVSAGARIGKVSNNVSAGYVRSDGHSRSLSGALNADYQTIKAFWQGDCRLDGITLDWQAGISSRDFGSNTFYSPKFDNQFEHTFKSFLSFQATTGGKVKFRPAIYWNSARDRFELIRGDASSVPFNHHRTNVYGVNLNAWTETILGRTAFGAEMRNEDIISTNLGEPLAEKRSVPGFDSHYAKGLNRTNISFFLEHTYSAGGFAATAGTALVKNTGNNDGFRFYPGANLSYRFAGNWKAYLSYNSSLRMPTFTELYYSVGGHAADKNLKAEKMQAFDGGLRYSKSGVNANVVVYYNLGSQLIDWIKDMSEGDDAPWKSVNFARVNTFGQEFSLRLDFPQILLKQDFFIRSLDMSYSHISQAKPDYGNIKSRYALEYLRHKFVAAVEMCIWKGLCLKASWRYLDRVGQYEVFENLATTGAVVPYKPYNLLDARLFWELGKNSKSKSLYTLFVEANNILNKEYYDYGNIPQPGIIVKGGVSVSIGK